MTTKVIIVNDSESNPAQELVVTAEGTQRDGTHVLTPGHSWSAWASSMSTITISEREAQPTTRQGGEGAG